VYCSFGLLAEVCREHRAFRHPCCLSVFYPESGLRKMAPSSGDASEPIGLPWGGYGSICMAIGDMNLARKGRFVGSKFADPSARSSQARPSSVPAGGTRPTSCELGSEADFQHDHWAVRPASPARPTAATMRKMLRGPSPTWESQGFARQMQYPDEILETPLGAPEARTRLPTPIPEASPKDIPPRPPPRPFSAPEPSRRDRGPLEGPGFTRRQWSRFSADGVVGSTQASFRSPRYAPTRYGAAAVRQQRLAGTACPRIKPGLFNGRKVPERRCGRPESAR